MKDVPWAGNTAEGSKDRVIPNSVKENENTKSSFASLSPDVDSIMAPILVSGNLSNHGVDIPPARGCNLRYRSNVGEVVS
jgi:hypothetical protein